MDMLYLDHVEGDIFRDQGGTHLGDGGVIIPLDRIAEASDDPRGLCIAWPGYPGRRPRQAIVPGDSVREFLVMLASVEPIPDFRVEGGRVLGLDAATREE